MACPDSHTARLNRVMATATALLLHRNGPSAMTFLDRTPGDTAELHRCVDIAVALNAKCEQAVQPDTERRPF